MGDEKRNAIRAPKPPEVVGGGKRNAIRTPKPPEANGRRREEAAQYDQIPIETRNFHKKILPHYVRQDFCFLINYSPN
ncbi:MAG: hypothetical protein Q4E53_12350 [Eubacteriales bacterium]|nr:hypothetical protein [Eubacteriales bacterium]